MTIRHDYTAEPESVGRILARLAEADPLPVTQRSRQPEGWRLRPELDAIRGVAILLVLGEHFYLMPTGTGTVGVTIFFALSGYLITSLLMGEEQRTGRIDLGAFYVRRARRLLPALLVLVAVVVVLPLPANPIPALTYTTNWYLHLGLGNDDIGVLRHTWSLALEEQFYLVWPVVFLFLGRWRVLGLLVALVVALNVSSALMNAGIVVGCLIAATVALPRFAWFAWRPLVRLGQISYGLYLWHYVISASMDKGWHVLPQTAGGIVLALVLALASERYVERPFRLRTDEVGRQVRLGFVRRGVPERSVAGEIG